MSFPQQINAALGASLDHVIQDGKMHRFSTNGRDNDTSGWYVHPDNNVVIAGCWRSGQTITLWVDGSSKDDPDALAAIQRARDAYRRERAQAAKSAADKSGDLLRYSRPIDANHPYIARKRINTMRLPAPLRARSIKSSIVLDMVTQFGDLVGLQFISTDGDKKFLTGTQKAGACHWLMDVAPPAIGDVIGVVEGWATGCAVAHYSGLNYIAVAMDAGNIERVVMALSVVYPHNEIIIYADDDAPSRTTGRRAGMAGANAAKRINPDMVSIQYPAWGANKPDWATDFCDLYQLSLDV